MNRRILLCLTISLALVLPSVSSDQCWMYVCELECENGRKADEKGCELCECKQPGEGKRGACPKLECTNKCMVWKSDSNQCKTCTCDLFGKSFFQNQHM